MSPQFKSGVEGAMQTSGYEGSQFLPPEAVPADRLRRRPTIGPFLLRFGFGGPYDTDAAVARHIQTALPNYSTRNWIWNLSRQSWS